MKCVSDGEFVYRIGDKIAHDMVSGDNVEFVPKQVWKDNQPEDRDGIKKPRLNRVKIAK